MAEILFKISRKRLFWTAFGVGAGTTFGSLGIFITGFSKGPLFGGLTIVLMLACGGAAGLLTAWELRKNELHVGLTGVVWKSPHGSVTLPYEALSAAQTEGRNLILKLVDFDKLPSYCSGNRAAHLQKIILGGNAFRRRENYRLVLGRFDQRSELIAQLISEQIPERLNIAVAPPAAAPVVAAARLIRAKWVERELALQLNDQYHTLRYFGRGAGYESVSVDGVEVVRRQGSGRMTHVFRFTVDGIPMSLDIAIPLWAELLCIGKFRRFRLTIGKQVLYNEGEQPS